MVLTENWTVLFSDFFKQVIVHPVLILNASLKGIMFFTLNPNIFSLSQSEHGLRKFKLFKAKVAISPIFYRNFSCKLIIVEIHFLQKFS